MTRQKSILLVIGLLLIGGTAGLLAHVKNLQTLGKPGVATRPISGSQNLEVVLPETLPGYTSEIIDVDKMVAGVLPKDTSFGQRRYHAANGFYSQLDVVLMGTDRTSMHKPQFCLLGQGWKIDSTTIDTIPVGGPHPYDLKVIKLLSTRVAQDKNVWRSLYVYWFVADNALSADPVGLKRMSESAWTLLHTGVLQRWAYVSYFTPCQPGQEDAIYQQMKNLISESVPEFQLVHGQDATGNALAAANR